MLEVALGEELSRGRGALRPGLVYSTCELRRVGFSKELELIVDGDTVASVVSTLTRDSRFDGVDRVRRSEVRFHDGFWLIRVRAPVKLSTKTPVSGKRPGSRNRKKDRIIELQARLFRRAGDSGEGTDAVLARVEHIQRRTGVCVTDRGERYELSGRSLDGFGKWHRGLLGLSWLRWAPLFRSVLIVREPVPLTVAICHWHLGIGDHRKEFSGGAE